MNREQIITEITFKASRSGGKGGQHVNKVSTKVTLNWNPSTSMGLSENEKMLVLKKLSGLINKEGDLVMHCEASRSQVKNKKIATEKLFHRISLSLQLPKKRKKSRPTKAQVEKRLKSKKIVQEKKQRRRKDKPDHN